MCTANALMQVNRAMAQFGAAVSDCTAALKRMNEEFIKAFAHDRAGNWPDGFFLLNRYMRTGVLPTRFSGQRLEL